MVQPPQPASSKAAASALLVCGLLLVLLTETILILAAYSNAVDLPSRPLWVALPCVLAVVPLLVGILIHRSSRRAGLSPSALALRLGAGFLAVGIVLLVAIAVLSMPL